LITYHIFRRSEGYRGGSRERERQAPLILKPKYNSGTIQTLTKKEKCRRDTTFAGKVVLLPRGGGGDQGRGTLDENGVSGEREGGRGTDERDAK
jgi:hypothetical protein